MLRNGNSENENEITEVETEEMEDTNTEENTEQAENTNTDSENSFDIEKYLNDNMSKLETLLNKINEKLDSVARMKIDSGAVEDLSDTLESVNDDLDDLDFTI